MFDDSKPVNANVERSEYLITLLAEIDAMDESLWPPNGEIQKGEKLIAVVTGYPRKVFALAEMYHRDRDRMEVEVKYDLNNKELVNRFMCLDGKHDLLMEMFWNVTKSQLGKWSFSTGIRKDWQLVELPSRDGHDFSEFFRHIIEE